MNDFDLFRRARPDIAPLDDATAEDIRRAVFGADTADLPSVHRINRTRVIAVVLAFAAAAALVVAVTRGDGTRSIAPASPTDSSATATTIAADTTVVTNLVTTVVTTAADPSSTDDWRMHPNRRFDASEEWYALFEQAREANIGRCMSAAGFEYTGSPFDTDSELADAAAGIQPGTYEAAYFGAGGEGGGCLDDAVGSIFGTMSAQVRAEEVRSWASVEWRRTALSDPEVLSALEVLAACAREHGVEVRDVGTAPSKALEDIYEGMTEQTGDDRRLAEVQATTPDNQYVHSIDEMQVVAQQLQDEWCPSFAAFDDVFGDHLLVAAVAWIESNPQTMADIDAEFVEDMARFQYIIDHDGELPPS